LGIQPDGAHRVNEEYSVWLALLDELWDDQMLFEKVLA